MSDEIDEKEPATLYIGDETWHDGPGWYYVSDEYPDEGSHGAFTTEAEARAHAESSDYRLGDPPEVVLHRALLANKWPHAR